MPTARSERADAPRGRRLVLASVLFIVAMLASTAHDLWVSHQETERGAGQEIYVLARALAEQTHRSMQAVDILLDGVANDERRGEVQRLSAPDLHDYLERTRAQLTGVAAVFLTDVNGRVSAIAGNKPHAAIDMAPAALQRLKTNEVMVDRVARDTPSAPRLLRVLRRIDGPDGRYAGGAGVLLDVAEFERFCADVQPGLLNVIALHDEEGSLLIRYPPQDDAIGRVLGAWGQAGKAAGGAAPLRRFVSGGYGVERLGIAQPVPGYPLRVVVSRDTRLVYAPWRVAAWGSVVRTLLLCVAASWLLCIVLRQLQRLEKARSSLATSERALRISEERYAVAVAGANEGLWDWDLVSDQVILSERAQRMYGLPPGEPQRPRREWLALVHCHPEDRQRVRKALADHLNGRAPNFEVEMRLARAVGQARPEQPDDWTWVRQRGLLVGDAADGLRRMAGSVEDITDRKRAEAGRRTLEMRLRTAQKLEAIGTLAGGIAHDFNNILGAILGYAELAQGHAAPGSALSAQLDGVMKAGLRAKSLVQRILAFSRSGLGEKMRVNVQGVVEEALDMLETSLPAGVHLERDLRAGDAMLAGDSAQIHQVVLNLGSNALQASRSPATVSVTLAARELESPRQFTSGELPAGRYLQLVVQDQGSGIEPGQIERIFDPFFTTKGVGVGTGLGLSLVHGIVTELRGAIDVQSTPGRGSTFSVLLPWTGDRDIQPRRDRRDETLPHGNGERVMVIDDEAALVELAEETLAALGYEPVGYTSSTAALQAFEQAPTHFDVILTDETMPQLHGSQLAAAVLRVRSDIPVLLMTGYLGPVLTARMRTLGVRTVLAKPLVAADIARALADALRSGAPSG